MKTTPLSLVLLSLTACVASGDGASQEVGCDWLANSSCWTTIVDDVAACAPPDTETAQLSTDRTQCLYPSGDSVDFPTPLTRPIGDHEDWVFELVTEGQSCLDYNGSGANLTATTASGTIVFEGNPSTGDVTITCPGGDRVHISDYFGVFDACPDAAYTGLPVLTVGTSSDSFSLGFTNSDRQDVQVFACQE